MKFIFYIIILGQLLVSSPTISGNDLTDELSDKFRLALEKANRFELLYAAVTTRRIPRPYSDVKKDASTRFYKKCYSSCPSRLFGITKAFQNAVKVEDCGEMPFVGLLRLKGEGGVLFSLWIGHNSRIIQSLNSCWVLPKPIDHLLRSRDIFISLDKHTMELR